MAVSVHCSSSPCRNNGSCSETHDGFTCHCLPGTIWHQLYRRYNIMCSVVWMLSVWLLLILLSCY